MEISPLSNVGLLKIFSHSLGCLFVLLTVSFALQKCLSFRRSHLFIVDFNVYATSVIFKKWFPVPMHWRLFPTYSSIRFSMVKFILRSLIHLILNFVYEDRFVFIWILLHIDHQLYQHHLLKMLFFPLYNFSLSKIRCSKVCGFDSISPPVSLCQHQAVFNSVALW